jgi:hypothetical protein
VRSAAVSFGIDSRKKQGRSHVEFGPMERVVDEDPLLSIAVSASFKQRHSATESFS